MVSVLIFSRTDQKQVGLSRYTLVARSNRHGKMSDQKRHPAVTDGNNILLFAGNIYGYLYYGYGGNII